MVDFDWRGRKLICRSERGVVLSSEKRSESRVSSTGGVGVINRQLGTVSVPKVTSTTTTKHEFWIKKADGSEKAIQLSGIDVPLREGQDVTMLSAMREGGKLIWYMALVNHTAGQRVRLMSPGSLSDKTKLGFGVSRNDLLDCGISAVVGFVGFIIFAQGMNLTGNEPVIALLGCIIGVFAILYAIRRNRREKLLADWIERCAQEAKN